jgi:hypothetical protein
MEGSTKFSESGSTYQIAMPRYAAWNSVARCHQRNKIGFTRFLGSRESSVVLKFWGTALSLILIHIIFQHHPMIGRQIRSVLLIVPNKMFWLCNSSYALEFLRYIFAFLKARSDRLTTAPSGAYNPLTKLGYCTIPYFDPYHISTEGPVSGCIHFDSAEKSE